jgi:hypothetical protein
MSATKEFTLKEIAEHNTKKDLYLIVHDKVYDCSSFVDEHPYVTSPHTLPSPGDTNPKLTRYPQWW